MAFLFLACSLIPKQFVSACHVTGTVPAEGLVSKTGHEGPEKRQQLGRSTHTPEQSWRNAVQCGLSLQRLCFASLVCVALCAGGGQKIFLGEVTNKLSSGVSVVWHILVGEQCVLSPQLGTGVCIG